LKFSWIPRVGVKILEKRKSVVKLFYKFYKSLPVFTFVLFFYGKKLGMRRGGRGAESASAGKELPPEIPWAGIWDAGALSGGLKEEEKMKPGGFF
jgi:hypothetical protein